MYSLASMATMAACIFMFGIFFCLVQNVNHIVKVAESGVAVTAFFEEGMTEMVIYLPKGVNWVEVFSGQKYTGGQKYTIDISMDSLPVFCKENSSRLGQFKNIFQ